MTWYVLFLTRIWLIKLLPTLAQIMPSLHHSLKPPTTGELFAETLSIGTHLALPHWERNTHGLTALVYRSFAIFMRIEQIWN